MASPLSSTVSEIPVPYSREARASTTALLSDAVHVPFWLDHPLRPEARVALTAATTADLAIVGAGFSGLWTALLAKEADPGLDVVVLEGARVGWAASGRNGGFCSPSITHGFANGLSRFPNEIDTLERLGHENLTGLEQTLIRYSIDAEFEQVGDIAIATETYQVEGLAEYGRVAQGHGVDVRVLDRDQTRQIVDTPLALGGLATTDVALVHPAKLAWGLRDAALALGVRIFEQSPVTGMRDDGAAMVLTTAQGSVRAGRVALATNAFPPLLARIRNYVVPVYDYVVVTEPLPADRFAELGWSGRVGVSDMGNQFHYSRLTADNRILWGGYDAVYHRNNGVGARYDTDPASFARLAEHLIEFFPALEGIRFTHAWGGAIDTCSRYSPFWGKANMGKVAYVAGYTGLGVGASRFGAQVMLDLLFGRDTELTRLDLVRSKPLPFPPEPARSLGINLTRWSLDQADRSGGRRNLWLRSLDRFGLGFDS
ncbi:MAG: FAD-dependent oxidoreductase [Actinomycetes bacterium]